MTCCLVGADLLPIMMMASRRSLLSPLVHLFTAFKTATSHSRIVLSSPAEARVLPSGLHATELTASECPLRVARHLRLATSHSFIVLSSLPEANCLPSGLKETDLTAGMYSPNSVREHR